MAPSGANCAHSTARGESGTAAPVDPEGNRLPIFSSSDAVRASFLDMSAAHALSSAEYDGARRGNRQTLPRSDGPGQHDQNSCSQEGSRAGDGRSAECLTDRDTAA